MPGTSLVQDACVPVTRHLLRQAGLRAHEADSGAITLIQRLGWAVNLNIYLCWLVLDGVYRRGTEGEPVFVEVPAVLLVERQLRGNESCDLYFWLGSPGVHRPSRLTASKLSTESRVQIAAAYGGRYVNRLRVWAGLTSS